MTGANVPVAARLRDFAERSAVRAAADGLADPITRWWLAPLYRRGYAATAGVAHFWMMATAIGCLGQLLHNFAPAWPTGNTHSSVAALRMTGRLVMVQGGSLLAFAGFLAALLLVLAMPLAAFADSRSVRAKQRQEGRAAQ